MEDGWIKIPVSNVSNFLVGTKALLFEHCADLLKLGDKIQK